MAYQTSASAWNSYNAQQGNVKAADDAYQAAVKNQKGYDDLYNQASNSAGTEQAKSQYQKSLDAVNATQTAMNNLPSAINAGSNVVLNSAQRNAALGNQMGKYANTLSYWQNQNAGDQNAYQTALGQANTIAQSDMAKQQNDINNALAYYELQLRNSQDLYSNYLSLLAQERAEAQEQARLQQEQANWQNYMNALNGGNEKKYKSWDFGNNYHVDEAPDGTAMYYRGSTPLSAGEFLSATGLRGSGVKWDLWNDIWNNGVSTVGVGSDTVEAYSPYNYANMLRPSNNEKYKYLYGD